MIARPRDHYGPAYLRAIREAKDWNDRLLVAGLHRADRVMREMRHNAATLETMMGTMDALSDLLIQQDGTAYALARS